MEYIATQGNIDVRHVDSLSSSRVSVRFADLPVAEGLKRLFRAADVAGYALITATVGESIQVRRILFLPLADGPRGSRPVISAGHQPSTVLPQLGAAPTAPAESQAAQHAESDQEEGTASGSGGSVFEELQTNPTTRHLLSQLMHPNEQVRERAMESLIQVVGDDQQQAQLLEFLEPLLDYMASNDQTARE